MARKGQRLARYTFAELDAIIMTLEFCIEGAAPDPRPTFQSALKKTKLRRHREQERAK